MKWSQDFVNRVIQGDAIEIMRRIPDESIDMAITSPPYYGLRDYGKEVETIWCGDKTCNHEWSDKIVLHDNLRSSKVGLRTTVGSNKNLEIGSGKHGRSDFCSLCGAWKGQLGLEPTLGMYLEHLLIITAEIKRVLKRTGVLFWNHGDSYGGSWQNYGARESKQRSKNTESWNRLGSPTKNNGVPPSAYLQAKSLLLQNFRLIQRMIDEQGWLLRNMIIWFKPNCMPSSVKDRFTVDYEPVFFFVKDKRYWFEMQCEPYSEWTMERRRSSPRTSSDLSFGTCNQRYAKMKRLTEKLDIKRDHGKRYVWKIEKDRLTYLISRLYGIKRRIRGKLDGYRGKSLEGNRGWNEAHNNAKAYREGLKILQKQELLTSDELKFLKDYVQNHLGNPQGRNKRCVWKINTRPFKGAHFATFPADLVEPMIRAGCPEFVCKRCGKPVMKKTIGTKGSGDNFNIRARDMQVTPEKWGKLYNATEEEKQEYYEGHYKRKTTRHEFIDKCDCNAGFEPGLVLDMFAGSGTTGVVAKKLGRRYILVELKPEYCKMARKRLESVEQLQTGIHKYRNRTTSKAHKA